MMQVIASFVLIVALWSLPTKSYARIDSRAFDSHQRNALWVLSKGSCRICKINLLPYSGNDRSAEADHIVPYSKGGLTTLDNGQMLCRKCNRKKSDK